MKHSYPYIIGFLLVVIVLFFWARSTNNRLKAGFAPEGQRSFRSQQSDRTSSRDELKAALRTKSIYESALAKYPDMRPDFRDVSEEQNGFLNLLRLAERWDDSSLPEELLSMLEGDLDWDASKLMALGLLRPIENE